MNNSISHQNISIFQIFSYFFKGTKLAFSKDVRHYIVIPILANILLIGLSVILFFTIVSSYLSTLFLGFGDNAFLGFLSYLVTVLLTLLVIFIMTYYFATISIIIASPFYGFLAQKIEFIETNQTLLDDSFSAILKDVPRILRRELDKQCFFIPRALVCLIITLIPGINVLSPIFWIWLTSYMATIQFCDYGFDNHKIGFKQMKEALRNNRLASLTFGFIIVVGIAIPILNLILPVIAVCAGTLYFIDIQRNQYGSLTKNNLQQNNSQQNKIERK